MNLDGEIETIHRHICAVIEPRVKAMNLDGEIETWTCAFHTSARVTSVKAMNLDGEIETTGMSYRKKAAAV